MEKYKIKRNPKPLSDEQINRHKDFGKLLSDQQKLHRYKDGTKPLYKNPGFMAMMVVIGVVLLMLIVDRPEKEGKEIPKDTIAVVKGDTGMQIPVEQNIETFNDLSANENIPQTKNVEKTKTVVSQSVAYEIFKIDPAKGAVLYTSAGLRLLIPSFAFSDQVAKEITIKYREISDIEKEGLKSVPSFTPSMSFELLGFESASGKAVNLSKSVILEYSCGVDVVAGDLYKYEKEKNEWLPKEKERFVYRFRIQANDSQFPELSLLTGLAWELPSEGVRT